MANAGWPQLRQQARTQEQQVRTVVTSSLTSLTPLDRVTFPHIFSIRFDFRSDAQAFR